MKIIILMLGLMIVNFASANEPSIMQQYGYSCKNVQVVVDSVIKNNSINGHVVGLPTEAYDKFKMVFYIKTNRWYIHPYAYTTDQAEGYSYTNLRADGSFKIKTILRDVPAKKLAAVLVPKNYKIRNQHIALKPIFGIWGILKGACNYTTVKGNGDFFL